MDKASVQAAQHKARDVPGLRDALLHSWKSGHLLELLTVHDGRMHMPVARRDEARGLNEFYSKREWAELLVERLAEAELFYVTADMTEVVEQASLATPTYQVFHDQLPAETGLMVFARPFCHVPPDRLAPGQRVEMMAAFWTVVEDVGGGEGGPQPGVMLVTLQDSDVLLYTQPLDELISTPGQRRRALETLRVRYGALAYHEEYPMPFGDAPWDSPGLAVRNQAVAASFTTWILMSQRITQESTEAAPRHLAKQARRQGRPEPSVRCVTLRYSSRGPREDDDQEQQPGQASRKYTKRWPVKGYGYWRNTWYPSRERHELQYVHVPGYMKGQPGAPLVGGERVNVLRK